MIRRPPGSYRTATLFPYTTLFRSVAEVLPDGEFEQLPDAFSFRPLTLHAGDPTAVVELSAMAGGDAMEHFFRPVGIGLMHPVGKQLADGPVEPHDGVPCPARAVVGCRFDNLWHLIAVEAGDDGGAHHHHGDARIA